MVRLRLSPLQTRCRNILKCKAWTSVLKSLTPRIWRMCAPLEPLWQVACTGQTQFIASGLHLHKLLVKEASPLGPYNEILKNAYLSLCRTGFQDTQPQSGLRSSACEACWPVTWSHLWRYLPHLLGQWYSMDNFSSQNKIQSYKINSSNLAGIDGPRLQVCGCEREENF